MILLLPLLLLTNYRILWYCYYHCYYTTTTSCPSSLMVITHIFWHVFTLPNIYEDRCPYTDLYLQSAYLHRSPTYIIVHPLVQHAYFYIMETMPIYRFVSKIGLFASVSYIYILGSIHWCNMYIFLYHTHTHTHTSHSSKHGYLCMDEMRWLLGTCTNNERQPELYMSTTIRKPMKWTFERGVSWTNRRLIDSTHFHAHSVLVGMSIMYLMHVKKNMPYHTTWQIRPLSKGSHVPDCRCV